MIDDDTDCHYCGEMKAVVVCHGCGIPLCNICTRLEDYGFGCDSGRIQAFCPDCFRNPGINTVLQFPDP